MKEKQLIVKRFLNHIWQCVRQPDLFLIHVENFVLDIKWGGRSLGGTIKTEYHSIGAEDTSNSSYYLIKECLKHIRIEDTDVFVDVGCGKGRILNYWAVKYPRNKCIGIEIDENIGAETSHRMKRFSNCEVIIGNVLEHFPREGTIFFLFNPFNETVMKEFKELVENECKFGATLIYYNCKYLPLFSNDSKWHTKNIEINHSKHNTSIIKYRT